MNLQLALLVYEMKGVIDSMNDNTGYDDSIPCFYAERLQTLINEATTLVKEKEVITLESC